MQILAQQLDLKSSVFVGSTPSLSTFTRVGIVVKNQDET